MGIVREAKGALVQADEARFYQAEGWGGPAPADYGDYRLVDVVAENDRVKLIPYADQYFDLQMKVNLELYPVLAALIARRDDMRDDYRRMILEESEELKVLVFDALSDEFVGRVVAQPPAEGVVELGWDVLPEFQRMGYAYAAVSLFMRLLERRPDCRGFVAAVEANNTASKALVRKLRGTPHSTRMLATARALRESGREKFKEEYPELLTKEVIDEAAAFGVAPEDLLTHALVFAIPGPSA